MKKTNLQSGPLTSSQAVVPAPGSGTNDIRGIKPSLDLATGWEWLIPVLVALLLALLGLWLWKRSKRKTDSEPAKPQIPAHVRARQRLEQALGLISDPRLFCIAISDAIRQYLEERFQLHAPERTTEEFLHELSRSAHLLPDQKISLGQFLEQCDLVKFAKHEPTEAGLRELHRSAERLIDETEPVAAPVNPSVPAGTSPPSLPGGKRS